MLQNLTVVVVAQLGKFNEGHWSDPQFHSCLNIWVPCHNIYCHPYLEQSGLESVAHFKINFLKKVIELYNLNMEPKLYLNKVVSFSEKKKKERKKALCPPASPLPRESGQVPLLNLVKTKWEVSHISSTYYLAEVPFHLGGFYADFLWCSAFVGSSEHIH